MISLQRRQQSAGELGSVVRTMKALSTANISQYQMAVESLQMYYRTISLGLYASFQRGQLAVIGEGARQRKPTNVAVIFGSDQGLVGRFNDSVAEFGQQSLEHLPGIIETWAVGERVYYLLADAGLTPTRLFHVPNSVSAITPLVHDILIKSEQYRQNNQDYRFYIVHNKPLNDEGYLQSSQQLYPPDKKWQEQITALQWPSENLPQVVGATEDTLRALIREYLFVSIYKACAESLAAENASRLAAMQRAEKNIDEMLEELKLSYNKLRKSTIDAELFDVIAGFEALGRR
ncbi:MAG: F0F1 ATP synthase subunit gamma [Proteobacteria bacterium]|nr:MAG: F0F1 ATP synthase subunit gamma [Pseudomonadota bacterium]